MNTQTKTTEQYFPVVPFIMLYKVFLTFESVEEIPKCYHSSEIHWAVPSCSTVYYAVQGSSNFWVCGWNPRVWPFKWKLLSSTFLRYCSLCCSRWFLHLSRCRDEILQCDISWKLLRLLCCGTVYTGLQALAGFWVCRWNLCVGK